MILATPSTAGVAGLAIAFAAGVISIATPCSLPLIPGYLAYMSGVSSGEGRQTKRVMGAAALFVCGFAVIFTALGAAASVLGSFLLRQLPLFVKISGAFVIVMGLASLGVLRLPFLYREKRFDLSKIRRGPAGAVPLGMAFAFGWTPCVGPVLGAIFAVAANTQTASHGALLLFVYSLGMGIPFLGLALAYSRAGRTFRIVRRHARGIEITGGVFLIGIGVLLVTGTWQQLLAPVVNLFVRHHWTL